MNRERFVKAFFAYMTGVETNFFQHARSILTMKNICIKSYLYFQRSK